MRNGFSQIYKKEDTEMEKRIIVIGSQTSAIKAVRLLENTGITVRIVRAPKVRSQGCRFGVEVSLRDLSFALSRLSSAHIDYSEITT